MILSGCGDSADQMKKFTPPEDEAVAKNYIDLLRHNKFELVENDFDPSIKSSSTQDTLAKMAAAIPAQAPISVKVVGAHSFSDSNRRQINLAFEYQFPSKWILINVATQKKDGVTTIIGFHVYPLADSLENLNKFTLKGKSPFQYAVLAFAALIPLFIIWTLVLCIRTKIEKRKWLWIIFILFGVFRLSINWTTGQWQAAPFYFSFLGSSAFAPAYGAWLISISLPLGAIIFLIRRKKLVASVEAPPS